MVCAYCMHTICTYHAHRHTYFYMHTLLTYIWRTYTQHIFLWCILYLAHVIQILSSKWTEDIPVALTLVHISICVLSLVYHQSSHLDLHACTTSLNVCTHTCTCIPTCCKCIQIHVFAHVYSITSCYSTFFIVDFTPVHLILTTPTKRLKHCARGHVYTRSLVGLDYITPAHN